MRWGSHALFLCDTAQIWCGVELMQLRLLLGQGQLIAVIVHHCHAGGAQLVADNGTGNEGLQLLLNIPLQRTGTVQRIVAAFDDVIPVSYTPLTLPTNSRV